MDFNGGLLGNANLQLLNISLTVLVLRSLPMLPKINACTVLPSVVPVLAYVFFKKYLVYCINVDAI